MKKLTKAYVIAAAFAVLALVGTAFSAFNPTTWIDGKFTGFLEVVSGLLDSAGTTRLVLGSTNVFTGNASLSGGQLSMGTVGTALSGAGNPGLSAGNIMYATLGGTVNAVEGSVLITSANNIGGNLAVTVSSTTLGMTNVVGIAAAAASTGSVVGIYTGGSWCEARTTGTVVAGDQLATSSLSAGYLYAPLTGSLLQTSTPTVAVALSSGSAAGGLTRVRFR